MAKFSFGSLDPFPSINRTQRNVLFVSWVIRDVMVTSRDLLETVVFGATLTETSMCTFFSFDKASKGQGTVLR